MNTDNVWIVNIRGNYDRKGFEITVVRKNNNHGISSYGWIGKDKLLITHDGMHGCTISKQIWDKQVKVAKEVAKELNLSEFNNTDPVILNINPW